MPKRNPFAIDQESTRYLTGKLIGGYVSQSVASYLRLLTVYKGRTIQGVLQEIVEEWQSEQEPESSIIEALADRAYMEWIRRKQPMEEWGEYEKEVGNRLRRRKVEEEKINTILEEMRLKIGKN